jgi:phosphopantothenoylcysteine synthetase/decarboxylase
MALIALGVTGGIGAYKAVEVARGLQRGATRSSQ